MKPTAEFPLEQWFDVSKPISKYDREGAVAQMAMYAEKEGLDPDWTEVKKQYWLLRAAVKKHNASFRTK